MTTAQVKSSKNQKHCLRIDDWTKLINKSPVWALVSPFMRELGLRPGTGDCKLLRVQTKRFSRMDLCNLMPVKTLEVSCAYSVSDLNTPPVINHTL